MGQTTLESARRDGLTVVDLSDDWLPTIFSEMPGKPQPLRPYLTDLANGRMRGGIHYARAREDRTFEAFGIFPTLNLLRRRLADGKRHACHDRVADKALEQMSPKAVIVPLDKDGKKKWHPPVSDRPTLTLYARVGEREVALCRWPTTIGGWKTIQRSDGTMALKYKESVTGYAIWPEILATPTWHPAPGMPTRKLLVKRGDTWEPKTEVIGPGYRAAYGLVASTHLQIEGRDERGEPQLMDHRIRTHGTHAYRSVKRGESSGCHRLHNHLALRLAGFLVRHRLNIRHGLVPEDYVRHLEYKGQEVDLADDNKGYRFELTPPVPINVLDGDVHGNARAVKSMVPLTVVP